MNYAFWCVYIYIDRKLTMFYGLTMFFGMDELVYKRARACLSVSENPAGQNSKCALWTPLSIKPIQQLPKALLAG